MVLDWLSLKLLLDSVQQIAKSISNQLIEKASEISSENSDTCIDVSESEISGQT